MKQICLLAAVCAALVLPRLAAAQTAPAIPPAITTPDKVETRIGPLDFKDGMPGKETIDKVYDNLDFTHAFEAFVNTYRGVSLAAARHALLSFGVKDNEVLIYSELMDAKSLYLTANADTVYFFSFIDLTKGPMVLDAPPKALGTLDDFWFRWVIDFGLPGPDRGEGGKYLILPPGYDGPLPEGGFYIARSRTTRVLLLGRSFMENNDPKPAVELIRKTTRIYPYEEGGQGTSIAEFLSGKAKLAKIIPPPPPAVFHEGRGKVINTIPPNDFSAYELLNEVVQQEPATTIDAELMGSLAAIGIVKGKPFAPDARMKKILTEAVALANATSRTLFMAPRDPAWYYYPGSGWQNMLFSTGYEFETPIPEITREGVKPFPPTGYRQLDAPTSSSTASRHHACDGHAVAGHRLHVPVDDGRCQQAALRRRQDLQGDAAEGHSAGELLVVHALRRDDALDARHAAALSTRGQPELPIARRGSGRRRHDDGLLRPDAASECQTGQLDPDHAGQGVFPDAAALQPARAVLRQDLAAERGRSGEIDSSTKTH